LANADATTANHSTQQQQWPIQHQEEETEGVIAEVSDVEDAADEAEDAVVDEDEEEDRVLKAKNGFRSPSWDVW